MTKVITFNELRGIKDSLPHGTIQKIADELGMDVDRIRNYFGGDHYEGGECAGFHLEEGPDGGIVKLDNTIILEAALRYINAK